MEMKSEGGQGDRINNFRQRISLCVDQRKWFAERFVSSKKLSPAAADGIFQFPYCIDQHGGERSLLSGNCFVLGVFTRPARQARCLSLENVLVYMFCGLCCVCPPSFSCQLSSVSFITTVGPSCQFLCSVIAMLYIVQQSSVDSISGPDILESFQICFCQVLKCKEHDTHAPTKTQCGHLSTHSRAVYAVGTHTRLKPAS